MNPVNYKEAKIKTKLERQLDDAIKNINELTNKDLFETNRKNNGSKFETKSRARACLKNFQRPGKLGFVQLSR